MKFLMLSPARLSRVSFLAGTAVAALSAMSFAACAVDCLQIDVPCPEGTHQVAECSTDDCVTVELCASEKLCEPSCGDLPTCKEGQNEVPNCEGFTAADCEQVVRCDRSIYCETPPPPCEALPTCDESDEEQPSGVCPDDASCYTAEICGTAILCLDNGLAHGCPPEPPLEGEPCSTEVVCEYPVEVDCIETWTCDSMGGQAAPIVTYAWHSGGTVCADPAD